jgi:hypothetical protein
MSSLRLALVAVMLLALPRGGRISPPKLLIAEVVAEADA